MNKGTILNLISAGLLIGILLSFLSLLFQIYDDTHHDSERDTYIWFSVEERDYVSLCNDVAHNRVVDAKKTDLMQQCYSVSGYFMAAFRYKMNAELGNKAEAKMVEEEMESLLPQLQGLEDVVEDIHHDLKLQTGNGK